MYQSVIYSLFINQSELSPLFLWQVSMSLTLGWETAPEQVIENDFSQEANLLGEKK